MEGALFSGLEHDRYAKPHAICFCMKYFSPTHVHTAANYDWLAAFLNGAADKMQYVYISCIAGEVSGTHHCRRSFGCFTDSRLVCQCGGNLVLADQGQQTA